MSISSTDMPGSFHPEMPFDPIDVHVGALLESDMTIRMPGENPVAIVHIGNVRNPDFRRSVWALQRRENFVDPSRTDVHMLRLDTYLPGPMPTTPDGQHIQAERVLISGDSITLDREVSAAGDSALMIPSSDMEEALSSARPLTLEQRTELISNMSTKRYEAHVPESWDMSAVRGLIVESEFNKQMRSKRAGGLLGRLRRRNNQ